MKMTDIEPEAGRFDPMGPDLPAFTAAMMKLVEDLPSRATHGPGASRRSP